MVEQQRWTEAEAMFTKAIHADPSSAAGFRGRARLFRARNRFAQADEDFSRAISEDPFHARTYEERGNLRRELQRLDEAIRDWRKAAELDPRLQDGVARRIEALTKTRVK
jgi:tetratricopeptide (TPR) repeat protein